MGLNWFLKYKKENLNYLKESYYIELMVLLAIPISLAVFFVIILIVVIIYAFMENRNQRRRFENEDFYEIEEIDEIADTYMKMLE